MSGYTGKPKILRGAFIEYGLSLPPLFVVFQFNPEQLSRSRSVNFGGFSEGGVTEKVEQTQRTAGKNPQSVEERSRSINSGMTLRATHQREYKDQDHLMGVRNAQTADFSEESISFDIRLDATDDMNDGKIIAGELGILPQLSTLELMTMPKSESLIADLLSGLEGGFGFTNKDKPPIVLFIWGYTRILPVNLNSINVTETDFNTILNPTRASISVDLTVIEGNNSNIPYTMSKAMKEIMSVINLTNVTDLANIVVPG